MVAGRRREGGGGGRRESRVRVRVCVGVCEVMGEMMG